jgi:hypothetical protein
MSILHILNGDATLHGFEQTGLEGDTFVWHEIFSQGPLTENIASAAFWKAREEWILQTFHEDSSGFVKHLEKIYEPYEEINLWFEFDLHCQANLLGVMMLLSKQTDLSRPAIYLICPGDFPGKETFRGMGELNGEELEYLYDNIRLRLNDYDFVLAAEAWKLYVDNNAAALEKWLNETTFWDSLHLLKPALEAHLKRLKINENGLNYIEQKLLDIYNNGKKNVREIYQEFWDTEKIYGTGDLEIDLYLKQLEDKGLIEL